MRGLVDWLLACPQKGYFVAVDPEFRASKTGAQMELGERMKHSPQPALLQTASPSC